MHPTTIYPSPYGHLVPALPTQPPVAMAMPQPMAVPVPMQMVQPGAPVAGAGLAIPELSVHLDTAPPTGRKRSGGRQTVRAWTMHSRGHMPEHQAAAEAGQILAAGRQVLLIRHGGGMAELIELWPDGEFTDAFQAIERTHGLAGTMGCAPGPGSATTARSVRNGRPGTMLGRTGLASTDPRIRYAVVLKRSRDNPTGWSESRARTWAGSVFGKARRVMRPPTPAERGMIRQSQLRDWMYFSVNPPGGFRPKTFRLVQLDPITALVVGDRRERKHAELAPVASIAAAGAPQQQPR